MRCARVSGEKVIAQRLYLFDELRRRRPARAIEEATTERDDRRGVGRRPKPRRDEQQAVCVAASGRVLHGVRNCKTSWSRTTSTGATIQLCERQTRKQRSPLTLISPGFTLALLKDSYLTGFTLANPVLNLGASSCSKLHPLSYLVSATVTICFWL